MASDSNVLATARLYIDRFGADAAVQAAIEAERFRELGDLDGAAVWRRVAQTIGFLRARRRPDQPLH